MSCRRAALLQPAQSPCFFAQPSCCCDAGRSASCGGAVLAHSQSRIDGAGAARCQLPSAAAVRGGCDGDCRMMQSPSEKRQRAAPARRVASSLIARRFTGSTKRRSPPVAAAPPAVRQAAAFSEASGIATSSLRYLIVAQQTGLLTALLSNSCSRNQACAGQLMVNSLLPKCVSEVQI